MAKNPLKLEDKRPTKKLGQPTKATPERIEAILADIARGFTRQEACVRNGASEDSLENWEKKDPLLRVRARANRKEALLRRVEGTEDWKAAKWLLEQNFPAEFGQQQNMNIFAQQNNYQITDDKAREMDARIAESTKRLTNGNGVS